MTVSNRIYLKPGEIYFSDQPCTISTVLGSCIAMTLWHPHLKIGGMCHYVLPNKNSSDSYTNRSNYAKPAGYFGVQAFSIFEKEVSQRFLQLKDFQVKIFGGSSSFQALEQTQDESIGSKNAAAAFKFASSQGMDIMESDVGRNGARNISFDLKTGDVWLKYQSTF